ncbi:MAG TPA: hypothetical protein VKC59_00445 [Candidatus Limnocylindrales bacterium]|nr:hypothetical protein [Candidatus Limnocylindrales bacterium]
MGFAVLVAAMVLGGCSGLVDRGPSPTAQDFGGIVGALGAAGIVVRNPQSGNAGCTDSNLIPTAIGFEATGLGVTTPIHLRVYIFGDDAAWQRRRPDVDACVATWWTDPATFETVDASPYVLAGQGPWPGAFKAAIRAALLAAAGSGG